MLVIVDYGVGNLASMQNMFKKIGTDAVISSDEKIIRYAAKLILPGVGAYDTCAGKLQESGLTPVLNEKVLQGGTPVLGVCVGMQLLLESSEEGVLPGLGWIRGKVVKFRQEELPAGYKIPHMGWTDVKPARPSRLLEGFDEDPRFYFVHSYYPQPARPEDVLVRADYGKPFAAGMENNNIMGVQFHPEKSHKFGMQLLANFVKNY
ncbi:MAG TPA: imidazole glycerol phosphate synthase subunit HisH [Puia sp.]